MADSSHRDTWSAHAEYYEYSKAANPIGAGLIPPVPLADLPHALHESGPTRIIPFDLSESLRCPSRPGDQPVTLGQFPPDQSG